MKRTAFWSIGFALLVCATDVSGDIVDEVEPNDTFATSQVLPFGTTVVLAELGFDESDYDFMGSGTLEEGVVVSHVFSSTAGEKFYAWTNNTPGDAENGPDTILGSFDESGKKITDDDDGSPVGNGLASALTGVVNPDDSISLKVTGYDDFKFYGDHLEEGDYDVFVRVGDFDFDVDFFTFTGLAPGTDFIVETLFSVDDFFGNIDTVLGLYDDDGNLIEFDDDGGEGLMSKLEGIVPDSGTLHVAVTGYDDLGFEGAHTFSGLYDLELTATTIPEPSTIAMWSIFGVIGLFVGWRKRRRAA